MAKILIVEDEPTLLTALVDKFAREGFTVLTAENGQNGLKSALKNHPDLILLDIIMPVMDGLTMLNKLREDGQDKHTKVILLTNLSDPGKIPESVAKSVCGYLVKSDWKIEDVVKRVNKELKK